jgi:hypothetical protein
MPIVRIRRASHGPEQYDATSKAGDFKNNPPEGLIVHTAGEVDGGFQVIDIWESLEAAERFEREVADAHIDRVLGEDYQPPEPVTYELRNIIRG